MHCIRLTGARRAFPVGRGNLSRDKFPTTQAPTDTVTQSPNDRQHNSVKNIEMFKNRLICTIMRGFIIESRLNVFVYCVWLNNTCAFFQEFCLGEIFWDVCKKRFMYKNFIKVLHYACRLRNFTHIDKISINVLFLHLNKSQKSMSAVLNG